MEVDLRVGSGGLMEVIAGDGDGVGDGEWVNEWRGVTVVVGKRARMLCNVLSSRT